jgi:hypothetical protein
VAVWSNQDERPSAFVTGRRRRCDNFKIPPERPEGGVAQRAGGVSGGNNENVPAAAQYVVKRGGLAIHADLQVGHALARPGLAAF